MNDQQLHGNTGKRNAARDPEDQNMTAKIQFFCWPEEKSAWIRASHPEKLSAWIRQQLNQATGRPTQPTEEERRRIKM
jgi:hypothetical protein